MNHEIVFKMLNVIHDFVELLLNTSRAIQQGKWETCDIDVPAGETFDVQGYYRDCQRDASVDDVIPIPVVRYV